jgi:hypothetical protein
MVQFMHSTVSDFLTTAKNTVQKDIEINKYNRLKIVAEMH